MSLPVPTLDGAIPDLLRRCSPVIIGRAAKPNRAVVVALANRRGPQIGGLGPSRLIHVACETRGSVLPLLAADLALDLSESTGRLRALQWIARQATGGSQPLDTSVNGYAARMLPDGAMFYIEAGIIGDQGLTLETYSWDSDAIPALNSIHSDMWSEKLPDGSSWYIAQIIKLVVEHLATRETP